MPILLLNYAAILKSLFHSSDGVRSTLNASASHVSGCQHVDADSVCPEGGNARNDLYLAQGSEDVRNSRLLRHWDGFSMFSVIPNGLQKLQILFIPPRFVDVESKLKFRKMKTKQYVYMYISDWKSRINACPRVVIHYLNLSGVNLRITLESKSKLLSKVLLRNVVMQSTCNKRFLAKFLILFYCIFLTIILPYCFYSFIYSYD